MGDDEHHHLHDLIIENHELDAHRRHEESCEARIAALEARIAELEGDHHRHEEYGDSEEVVEEIV